jgi:uncharacterized protein YkwD
MFFRPVLLLLVVALLAALPASAQAAKRSGACAAASASPSQATDREIVRATLCLLNDARAQRGMRALRLNRRLSGAADNHSQDMVRKNYFAHNSLSGASFVDRIRRSGYLRGARSWSVAENLAWGTGSRATPTQILRAWMESPGHKANILDRRYREVGIGIADGAPGQSGRGAATYTTDFGVRG